MKIVPKKYYLIMDNLPGGQVPKYFVTYAHWVRFTFRSLAKQNKKNLLDTTSPKRTVYFRYCETFLVSWVNTNAVFYS